MTTHATAEAVQDPTFVADLVGLHLLTESPLNARQTFNAHEDDELVASVRAHGVLTPLLVRPTADGRFEIGAGHRRYRAARKAGLQRVPAIIREMDDDAFLELIVVENLQRANLEPLDEAMGFQQLVRRGADLDKVAARIGRSRRYIYDRMKLLALVPQAQAFLRSGRLPLRHAEVLARLQPDQQTAALALARRHGYGGVEGPLFEEETRSLYRELDERALAAARKTDPYAGLRVKSLATLEAWVARHCRFVSDDAVNVELFPETAAAVEAARGHVLSLTYSYHVAPEVKEGGRILGPKSWKRADGREGSKPCDHAQLGVIVEGAGYGQAFPACAKKDTCRVHWAAEQRQRKQAATARTGSAATGERANDAQAKRAEREAAERAKEVADRKAFEAASPAILQAIAAKVAVLPIAKVLALEMEHTGEAEVAEARRILGLTKGAITADAFVRCALFLDIENRCFPYQRQQFASDMQTTFGVDVAAIVRAQAAPAATPATPGTGRARRAKR